jgi:glycosyltransferase involved in cell wall biosynthesis
MHSISVIIATLNSEPIIEQCLQSIRSQNYDQDKIEFNNFSL